MRLSEPILIAADTPYDPGPFRPRTHVQVAVLYYSGAAGSTTELLPSSAGGNRDGSYVVVVGVQAPHDAATPYADPAIQVEGTGVTTLALAGGKFETVQELGGMTRLEIIAAQQGPPDDAAGAVSYRILVGVEAN